MLMHLISGLRPVWLPVTTVCKQAHHEHLGRGIFAGLCLYVCLYIHGWVMRGKEDNLFLASGQSKLEEKNALDQQVVHGL